MPRRWRDDLDLILSIYPPLNRNRIERSLGLADDRVEKLSEIARGYSGWLLTSPTFLDECDQLLPEYRGEILVWEWRTTPASNNPRAQHEENGIACFDTPSER